MRQLERLARVIRESRDSGNPPPEALRELIESLGTVAVVGLSRDPIKAARRVPSYLAAKGLEVIPVNPYAERILGRMALDRLAEVDPPIDLVLVFRPSEEAGAIIEEVAGRPDRPAVWLQEGIRADEAAKCARAAGVIVVQDLCLFKAHRALQESLPLPTYRNRQGV